MTVWYVTAQLGHCVRGTSQGEHPVSGPSENLFMLAQSSMPENRNAGEKGSLVEREASV